MITDQEESSSTAAKQAPENRRNEQAIDWKQFPDAHRWLDYLPRETKKMAQIASSYGIDSPLLETRRNQGSKSWIILSRGTGNSEESGSDKNYWRKVTKKHEKRRKMKTEKAGDYSSAKKPTKRDKDQRAY